MHVFIGFYSPVFHDKIVTASYADRHVAVIVIRCQAVNSDKNVHPLSPSCSAARQAGHKILIWNLKNKKIGNEAS